MSNPFKTFEFYYSSSRNLRKQAVDHKSYKILSLPWAILEARTRNFGLGRRIQVDSTTAIDNLGVHDLYLIRN